MDTPEQKSIYQYKVHLYVYDLAAIDLEKRNVKEPTISQNTGIKMEELKKAADGLNNLIIEPVSCIELAQFYSHENKY